MKPKIIFWNVRGLNDRAKRCRVGNLLKGWKPNLVCLQETKVASVTRAIIRSLFFGWWEGVPCWLVFFGGGWCFGGNLDSLGYEGP